MNTFQTCNQHINKGCWSWMQSFSNRDICNKNKSELAEFGAKKNHVHLIVDLHPDNNISQLIGGWQRFVNFTPISPSNPYLN